MSGSLWFSAAGAAGLIQKVGTGVGDLASPNDVIGWVRSCETAARPAGSEQAELIGARRTAARRLVTPSLAKMCLVWVRRVLSETNSSSGDLRDRSARRRAAAGPAAPARSTGPPAAEPTWRCGVVSTAPARARREQTSHVLAAHARGARHRRSKLVMAAPSSRNSRTYASGSGASSQARVEALHGSGPMALGIVRERLQHADLEKTAGASGCLGRVVQQHQQSGGLLGRAGVRMCPMHVRAAAARA